MKKSFLIIGIVFIIVSFIFLYLHYSLTSDTFKKGIIVLNRGESRSLDINYQNFIFEYKDNISKPLKVVPINAQIINTSYRNGTYYLIGNSFYGSKIIIENNYTEGVLIGFVILDNSPDLLVYSLSLMFFIVSLIAGGVIAGISFLFKDSDTEVS
ncbi:hypothetical protein [Stygiolobus caldivivus]|uniref:hypothetical protein n=1 Tax=Stygiolobus caldivivus TaxID=2824673 RepID=UPI001C84ABC5|nr:hypothetical protein [Stygiolobus caldivivus]